MTSRRALVAGILQEVAEIGRELTAARARPLGEHRLSKSQLDALFILSHAPAAVSAGDLADALTVTPGAVTQLVGGLRELGLVETLTPPEDARMRVIRLTASAREQVDAFERHAVERLAPRFDGLDIDELERLRTLLVQRRERS